MSVAPGFSWGGLKVGLEINIQGPIASFTKSHLHANLIVIASPCIVDMTGDTMQSVSDRCVLIGVL